MAFYYVFLLGVDIKEQLGISLKKEVKYMDETNQISNVATSEQTEVAVETQPQDVKTFTQDDVDRIVTKRLEKESKKWQEKFDALAESQKLSQMSEEERANHEYNKRLSELETREQALQAKEQAYNQQQYKATIQAQLSEAGLPDVSDMLVGLEAEAVANQINVMKESFQTQLNAQLQSRINSSADVPIKPLEAAKSLTIEEIAQMSPQEIIKRKAEVDQVIKAYYQK